MNQGEWANAARSMVSIFIRQSHTINLGMDIMIPSKMEVSRGHRKRDFLATLERLKRED